MTPFVSVTHIAQGILFTLAFLVFIAGLICLVVSVQYKVRIKNIALLSVICFAEGVLQWLLLSSVQESSPDDRLLRVSVEFGNVPLFAIILYIVFILVFTVYYGVRLMRFIKMHITAMSVKESMDKLPTGLCFYAESGLPLLVNHSMAYVCQELTGKALLSGADFWDAVSNGDTVDGCEKVQISDTSVIKLPDGSVKSFVRKELQENGATVYEIIAYDVTAQHALSEALDIKNKKLQEMNARLREYGDSVSEFTREKEILAAKVKIHDRLGKLLLTAKRQLVTGGGEEDRKALIKTLKESNILLSVSDDINNDYDDLRHSATLVGVELTLKGELPQNAAVRKLFITAMHECLTNTVSHVDGKTLFVCVEDKEKTYKLTCSNDGRLPENAVVEGGGLSTLRRLAEKENGQMTIISSPEYMLIIEMPKEQTV